MEKIGIERISNGYVVYGTEYKTYREKLVDAEKEFQLEAASVVRGIRQEEQEQASQKK